jgi:hypothetical protein
MNYILLIVRFEIFMAVIGILRRVAVVRTDVLEEGIASIFSVKGISKLGKTLAVSSISSSLDLQFFIS